MEDESEVYEKEHSSRVPVKEINLKEWAAVIRRRLWIIVLTTVLFAVLGGLYSSQPEVPLYASSARIMIPAATPEQLSTIKVFIREPVVLERVVRESGLQRSASGLRNQISVGSVDNSIVTIISVVDPDPAVAPQIVNTIVRVFTEEVSKRMGFNGISVLTEAAASPNPSPVNPPSNRALIAGIMAGLIIGLGLALLRESLDDTLRTERELERILGVDSLGTVSRLQRKDSVGKSKRKNEYVRGEAIGS
ncbi:capsular polysaccharide biosynthesis protein [Paenibacillus forsythiae]|uniref:Capsular polysaccharide biosynthesis protein n=1 Tax=Paenibacillus forsythiae TaxID=365616 RepID=A0ABU3HDC6_9BACL|nr:Wzz/FepE/Etk N-terminal domain-containing protein [Paenibacillus forsythiae]MDT3428815.1 capsular polysaccharide biosynthesis protein [Paenibacillus forsythiae]